MGFVGLDASAAALAAGVILDAALGDPRYSFHPVRLMGATLSRYEKFLRNRNSDGYAGGFALFLLLTMTWVVLPGFAVSGIYTLNSTIGFAAHVYLVYSMLAFRDLLDHVRAVQRQARGDDESGAREAIARMVGRDTAAMDREACRRAAIESLAENFVDGFLSPVFWYVLLGLPGLLLFKVVSTMDSMVGYKTARYLRFGWCGARLDDVMNYIPARMAWLLLGVASLFIPNLSTRKGWRIGLAQHALVPGPNPGWSEATMAGVLQRRLIGPIYKDGKIVTTLWLGDPSDPEGGKDEDVTNSIRVAIVACVIVVIISVGALL